MIEYALQPGGKESGQERLDWIQTTSAIELHNINFERCWIRIDGVVYKEESEECAEAFKKAKLWMMIKDD